MAATAAAALVIVVVHSINAKNDEE